MLIRALRVQNLRSVRDEMVRCDSLTALVGRNGSGKSTFLRALELFYAISPKLDLDDFYDRDDSLTIVVSVTFEVLSEEAKKRFASYAEGDSLTVERVIHWVDGKAIATLHGSRLQAKDFVAIREAVPAREKKDRYERTRALAAYVDLPGWKSQDQGLAALVAWEAAHQEALERLRDDGQFFGFTPVGEGYLGRFTRLLCVPAVRDASTDSEDRRGAVLTELMDLVVRSALARKEDVVKLKEETQERYEKIFSEENLPELAALQKDLTSTLCRFVPDAGVRLVWQQLEGVSIPPPKAEVRLVEDGFESSVDRTGHGLQRAFLMTLLEHLAMAQVATRTAPGAANAETLEGGAASELPNLFLAIEEPELYQHPSRQRYLASILMKLASGGVPGVAKQTQVLYATHSPFFVGIDRIDQIRLLRKTAGENAAPRTTRVICTTLEQVAERLWEANGATGPKYTAEALRARLQAVMTPWMSEGFFGDTVVLVEGEDDRAAILGVAMRRGVDLDSLGVSVIPCGGKTNLDRPAVIFSSLGIRVFLVWDNDRQESDAKVEDNHRLLRIVKAPVKDWPCDVNDRYACFDVNLEATLKRELGEAQYEAWLAQAKTEFAIPKRKHAMKNPAVVARILELAGAGGKGSATLEAILAKVLGGGGAT